MNNSIEIQGGYHKYDEITFLKGFSITTIVIMHLMQGFMKWLPAFILKAASFGGTGVHVFFFCSGFGLYLSYIHKPTSFISFSKKRFLKIYIPYIIIVILTFLLPVMQVEGNRFVTLLSHIFLFKMFFPIYEQTFGPFWFISTIFQFYLIFIPLCRIINKIGIKRTFVFGFVLSVLWWCFTSFTGLNEERVLGSFFLQYLWEFILGMLVADKLYKNHQSINIPYPLIFFITIIGIILEGLLGFIGGPLKALNDIPALFGYGALGLLLCQIPILKKIGIWLGSISYEWYLVHVLTFVIAFRIGDGYITAVVAFISSIIIAFLYHLIIIKIQHLKFKK